MTENEIDNNSENEIENDFNNENISNMILSNENEVENIFNEELNTSSTRYNNKIMNTSGLSLLRELEDKWDSIERKKNFTYEKKNIQNKILKEEKKSQNIIKLTKEIEKLKKDFLIQISKQKEIRNNKNEEFEKFILNKITEMEKYKVKNEEIKKLLVQREMEKVNENKKKNTNFKNYNNFQKDSNNKITRNQLKKNKSFLHDEIYNYDKKKIPLRYKGNLFTCKEITEIEGLVYETPNDLENNNKIKINNPISDNLKNKMKNVYDDIIKPTYIPDYILNNFESSRINNNLSNEKNESLKNIKNNNIDNNNNININNRNNLQNNSLVNFNINSNFQTKINTQTLYSLERNFDEILNSINPNMNKLIKGNNYMGTYKKNDYNSEQNIIKKNNLESDENINPELDKYFEDLSIQAGYKLPNKINKKENINQNIINDDTYYLKDDIKDKKFLRKMEENVQLLNQLAKVSPVNNIFHDRIKSLNNSNNNSLHNINDFSKLNKSYIRSHNMSLNTSENINNSNINIMNNNRVYSKNRFEDILPKMYKSNALKIHKIIQNK